MTEQLVSTLLAIAMVAIAAVAVFESVKADQRAARRLCICGHRMRGPRGGGHVQPMDWDSNAYIDGAEYSPWKCRECRCRRYITK